MMKMPTQRPLKELVPEVLEYITRKYEGQIIYNAKLIEIYEGQLLKYVEESLAKELNPKAFERAKERIAPINVLRKIIEKQSKTYNKPASRSITEGNDNDTEILQWYEDQLETDVNFQYACEIFNLCKYVALEPYVYNGEPGLRVINPDSFLVYSDSPVNPATPTVFIKFMGKSKKWVPEVDRNGNVKKNANDKLIDVDVYSLYSTTEYVKVDSTGEVLEYIEHDLGQIPFVYIKSDKNKLIPTPDSDNFAMSILIPKLFSDLNYAVQYLSHSIMYAIDVDPSQMDGNPDSVWLLKSKQGEGTSPQIGTVDPKVDSDKVNDLILSQFSLWLETKGLKTGTTGKPEASASGIAKIIDESDASSLAEKLIQKFRAAELDFWGLIKVLNDKWASNSEIDQKAFSQNSYVTTQFAEQKPVVDKMETLKGLEIKDKLGITTPELALKELYPEADDTEIQAMLDKIEEYRKEKQANLPEALKNTQPNEEEEDDGETE